MRCQLEENGRIFDALYALRDGYENGDFSKLFTMLSDDCVMESQWVLEPNVGREAVEGYYRRKGETLVKTDSFPSCYIVELIGTCNPTEVAELTIDGKVNKRASGGIIYDEGKLCLLMEQTLNDETHGVLVDVTIGIDGMVKRIDLCMPELFKYREFYTFVDFMPAQDDLENAEAKIRISESYYPELYLFFRCAGTEFDEYDDLHITMEQWCTALSFWKKYYECNNFDEAFECIAGINYEMGTVERPEVAASLGRIGENLWKDRETNRWLISDLIAWTDKYRNSYSHINTCGW